MPILLLIALFTAVSGKPLDGFLMLVVATTLFVAAARPRCQAAARDRRPGVNAETPAGADEAGPPGDGTARGGC
ncbi:MAG TPA: hypothetical protein VMB74_14325 [Streptosporangiaceae bacterium]|nr:hypothetical protein [Streptosporangiaceae bacterium]